MKLTDTQEKAIKHGGLNLQLIACAGSGKTEVVARRVVHLLTPGRPDSLLPRNIVAFDRRYPAVEQIPLEENFRSSEGVVETARAFIEQNSARLAQAMKPTGAQPYDSGDIVALS